MEEGGIWLIVIGIGVALASLLMTTSVDTSVPDASGSLYGLSLTRTENVYNLGLLQHQMMVFVAGCSIAVMGVATTAAGAVLNTLPKPEKPTEEPAAPIEQSAPATPLPASQSDEEKLPQYVPSDDNDIYWYVGIGVVLLIVIVIIAISSNNAQPTSLENNLEMNTVSEMNTSDR